MNREHWKSILPFVEAFANGEDVECLIQGRWEKSPHWAFDGKSTEYRIAPKEKTGWINIYDERHGAGVIHPTKEDADNVASEGRIACIQITYKEGDGL